MVEIAIDKELSEFSMDTDWYRGYDMDSLGAVQLVVEVQKEFHVRIPDDMMPKIRTGTALAQAIAALQACRGKEQS